MKGKEVSVHPVRPRDGDTRDLAAQLAPLEELRASRAPGQINGAQVVAQENGAIVVGVEYPEVAKEAVAEKRNGGLGLEPVVLVIVGLLLAFIAFIAWQISRMPPE